MTKVLILLLPGLGDALVAAPIIRGAAQAEWTLDALTMLPAVTEYTQGLEQIRRTVEAPLLSDVGVSLNILTPLRRERYDVVVVPFPATRWQYAAVARFVGARLLCMHDYGGLSSWIARTTKFLPVQLRGGHRMSENMRMAKALDLPQTDHSYVMPAQWRSKAGTRAALAIHAGSMVYKGNEARRWPLENFIALIESQLAKGRSIRFFLGPNERSLATAVGERFHNPLFQVVDVPLAEAARCISECQVFVGNDAGLAHIAAGLGVKTLALFGMTNPERAIPIGKSLVLRDSPCPPCHDEGKRGFDCVRNIGYRCIRDDLTVENVDAAVDRALSTDFPTVLGVPEGPFQLYGRPMTPSSSASSRLTTPGQEN